MADQDEGPWLFIALVVIALGYLLWFGVGWLAAHAPETPDVNWPGETVCGPATSGC